MTKVYVQGPAYYESTAEVFAERGYQITTDITEADIVVLTGGEDINPAIYGESQGPHTWYSSKRDTVDMAALEYAVTNGKFVAGICRGAQLANCMFNGGKLWQDVDRHNSYHEVKDFITDKVYPAIISVHHQQMRPGPDAVLVAAANVCTRRDRIKVLDNKWGDVEVVWYPKTKCLCYQAHPEFGHKPSNDYFFELMDRYYHGHEAIK